jgi:hypothetical protein
MAKKITLDDLAAMVKRGFDEVNERLDTMDGRLARLEYDVSEIKLKLPYFAYAMDVKALQERVARLEKKTGLS